MSADYPEAEAHFVPRSFMFDSNACKAIVIHKTAGDATPQAVYNTFLASGNPGKSVHYAVGTDGTIWQFVPESLGAGGNCCVEAGYDPFWEPYMSQYGNLNLCTISVEHCDPATDNSTPLTPAQKAASFALVAYLAKKYNIPASHIKTHASIDPQSRARCPGNYPFSELVAHVQNGGSTMGVPTGWKDVNGVLIAPNNVPVHDGFRAAIEDDPGFDPANVPNEAEYNANPVMLHRPDLGNGDRQTFRDGAYYWTSQIGVVWEKYPGLEIDACYKRIAAQQAEITALKAQLAQVQQPAPVDTTALVAAINQIPDAIAPAVAAALVEAKKL